MKVIGIIGSRRRDTEEDFQLLHNKFLELYEEGDVICSGGCKKGGDRFAEILIDLYNTQKIIHLPEFVPKGSPRWAYTKANYARNTLIAQSSDILIACVASDRKGGTEDTIKKFEKIKSKDKIYLV
jgi:hypothetical protein